MAIEVIARHLPVCDKHVRPTVADKLDHDAVRLAHIVPQPRSSAESVNQQGVDLRTLANYKRYCYVSLVFFKGKANR